MNKHMVSGFAAVAAAFAVAIQVQTVRGPESSRPRPPDEQVVGTYVCDDGNKIELLGVCSITPDTVDCWDRAGVRSPKLTKRVQSFCLRAESDIPFRLGRKNRFVVFGGVPRDTYMVEAPGDPFATSVRFDRNADSGTSGIYVSAELDAESTQITIPVAGKADAVDLALRAGAGTTLGGASIRIEAIKSGVPPVSTLDAAGIRVYTPAPGKNWSVFLSLAAKSRSSYPDEYALLDKDHYEIRYVDMTGKPISAVTFLDLGGHPKAWSSKPPDANRKREEPPRCAQAEVRWVESVEGAVQLAINADPEEAAYLHVTRRNLRRVRFKDIPLDPKE